MSKMWTEHSQNALNLIYMYNELAEEKDTPENRKAGLMAMQGAALFYIAAALEKLIDLKDQK